jgi:hypothetical protein
MRRLIALVLASALLLGVSAPAAHAGDVGKNVALGLASFAVFNQLVGPLLYQQHRPAYARTKVVYATPSPPVVYAPPPSYVVVQPPPPPPSVVYYPHGRYELRGDGYTYHWVWIPNPPPPPPPPAAAPTALPSVY